MNRLFLLLLVVSVASTAMANRNPWGLDMDLDSYCKSTYGARAKVVLRISSVFGWKCDLRGTIHPINYRDVCISQHGTALFGYGKYLNYKSLYCGPGDGQANPWGWGVEVQDYCEMVHGLQALATLVEDTAFGWRCDVDGQMHKVDMREACERQHGTKKAAVGNKKNPYSWYCDLD